MDEKKAKIEQAREVLRQIECKTSGKKCLYRSDIYRIHELAQTGWRALHELES